MAMGSFLSSSVAQNPHATSSPVLSRAARLISASRLQAKTPGSGCLGTLYLLHAENGSFPRRRAAAPSDIATPVSWPLEATWNEKWQPETDVVVETRGKVWKVTFVIDTGSAFTTFNNETSRLLGLGIRERKVSMSVNGVKLAVGINSGYPINILGADFFLATNAIIRGDYTGEDETDWKLTVSRGDELGQHELAKNEVPVVEPKLGAFEGVIDVHGLVWVCFPTESRHHAKNIMFIVDTANPGVWIAREHLVELGFTEGDIQETYNGYVSGLELNIAGTGHSVLVSRDHLCDYTLVGTTFFTDPRAFFELNYRDRSVQFTFRRG